MRQSVRGHLLPESHEDALKLDKLNAMLFCVCVECGRSLTFADAASSHAGRRETQISGMCEPCFDALFEEDDE